MQAGQQLPMNPLCSSLWVPLKPSLPRNNGYCRCSKGDIEVGKQEVCTFSYQKFVDFALAETKLHTHLLPSPLQEKFSHILAVNGKAELKFQSFEASKIRLLRSMHIHGDDKVQVVDFAAFPRVEFDLPIFCANFFTSSTTSIIVLDLNPLHDVILNKEYKEKYYKQLVPLGLKYAELLPWGGKLTAESLRFFSPIVIWTRFTSSKDNLKTLFAAFKDYYKAWLNLMKLGVEETESSVVKQNLEAQHRYLTWRVEKDPGHQMLMRLIGEARARDVLRSFLFSGVDELASKSFLDYFPEYRVEDGTINEKRSVIGKSFENRPWDNKGGMQLLILKVNKCGTPTEATCSVIQSSTISHLKTGLCFQRFSCFFLSNSEGSQCFGLLLPAADLSEFALPFSRWFRLVICNIRPALGRKSSCVFTGDEVEPQKALLQTLALS